MAKSDSYAKPGHVGGVALFFKQDREDHAKRKKIWTNAFTASAYAASATSAVTTQFIRRLHAVWKTSFLPWKEELGS